jgi:hypothetical protein
VRGGCEFRAGMSEDRASRRMGCSEPRAKEAASSVGSRLCEASWTSTIAWSCAYSWRSQERARQRPKKSVVGWMNKRRFASAWL